MTRAKPNRLTCRLILLPLLAWAAGLSGCLGGSPDRDGEAQSPSAQMRKFAAQEEEKRADRIERGLPAEEAPKSKEDQTLELEKAIRASYLAELELQIAVDGAAHRELKAADQLALAQKELVVSTKAFTAYRRMEAPELLKKQKLKVDQLVFRQEEASQNLAQMREEYANFETDSVAKRTGEIVIWRAETRLDFATREIELAKAAHVTMTRNTLPAKIEALEMAATAKKNAVRRAQEALQLLAFENKLSLTKAQDKVVFKKMALESLRAKTAKP